jgi:hypothetical protein
MQAKNLNGRWYPEKVDGYRASEVLIAAYISDRESKLAANAQREEEWRELFLLRGMGWGRTDEQEARFLALRARLLGEGA